MKLLSEEILKIRKDHKLTQQEFADRIYVTGQAVSKWECDKTFPSQGVVIKIKEEFNVDLNELVTEEEIKLTVVSNNAAIKKLNKTNKLLIAGILTIVVIVLITATVSLFFNSGRKENLWIDVDIRYNYVTWEELLNAEYYEIVIEDSDEKALDRYEGYPTLYRKEMIDVEMDDGTKVNAMVYIMNYGNPALPYKEYLNTIIKGYQDVGLDPSYLEETLIDTKNRM